MTAKATLTCRPNSFKFCDRIIDLEVVGFWFEFKTKTSTISTLGCESFQC